MDSYKVNNFGIIEYLYVISCAIAFISKIGYIQPSPIIQYSIFIFWILLAILKFGKNKFNIKSIDKNIRICFLLFLTPKIVVHLYSFILYVTGVTDYFTRNTKTYLIVLSVFAIVYIFGKKSLNYTIASCIISFSIIIFYDCWMYGVGTIPKTFISIFTGEFAKIASLYEVHDYTFAIGYLILYYLFVKERLNKLDLVIVFVLSIFTIMGFKRIQILTLILIMAFCIICKIIKNKYKFYKFTSYIFILISYFYIFTLSSGVFFKIINSLGINSMGRNYYYEVIIKICKFNLFFLGKGRNYVPNTLTTDYAYLNVGGVHSDILKYYAECGFILFGIWMWYYLIKFIKVLNNKYTFKVVQGYYLLTIYSFMIYYTDNIEIYFISQYIYMLIVVTLTMNDSKLKNNSLKEEMYN